MITEENRLKLLAVIQYNLKIITESLDLLQVGDIQGIDGLVDSLYLESVNSEANNIGNYLKQIVIHLFKLIYGNNLDSHEHLKKEITNFRDKINTFGGKNNHGEIKTNILNIVEVNLQSYYDKARNKFIATVKENKTSYNDITGIPEECPWSMEELMEDKIDNLINKL